MTIEPAPRVILGLGLPPEWQRIDPAAFADVTRVADSLLSIDERLSESRWSIPPLDIDHVPQQVRFAFELLEQSGSVLTAGCCVPVRGQDGPFLLSAWLSLAVQGIDAAPWDLSDAPAGLLLERVGQDLSPANGESSTLVHLAGGTGLRVVRPNAKAHHMVQYLLPVPNLACVAVLSCITASLDYLEILGPTFDAIASTLTADVVAAAAGCASTISPRDKN